MWVAMSVVGSFFGVGVNFSPKDRRLVSSVVSFSLERLIIVVLLLGTGLVICRGPEIVDFNVRYVMILWTNVYWRNQTQYLHQNGRAC